jgi:hypothetical protein
LFPGRLPNTGDRSLKASNGGRLMWFSLTLTGCLVAQASLAPSEDSLRPDNVPIQKKIKELEQALESESLPFRRRLQWPNPVVELSRAWLSRMDEAHRRQRHGTVDLDARIASYELAARMQLAATDALDTSQESEATKELYGLNDEATASYGRRRLMARRLVERGVRMIQIYIEGQIWDNHTEIEKSLRYCCGKTDKPIAGLIQDLKQRGLLESTLVVWGGEFGRLPIAQKPGATAGRDHGPSGFSVWMSGGGIKGGTAYGATDEIGFRAVENRVSIHDFHATILHLLGLNHRNLLFEREGRSERLTDEFPARVVEEIIT